MRTKLSGICDALLESGWLLALVIVPLYFDVYSSRVFEPDKLALLRSIATLMALAGAVKLVEEHTGRHADTAQPEVPHVTWRTPLVVPTLALAGVYLLATALSVVPRTSLWGSYQRLQGTYSTLSYMVIFAMLLTNLRRREQLDRLLGAVILTSLPVALYGILQHYQLDPLPWGGDTTFRVASTMGNPIFAAAYLIMVIPLSAGRVVGLLKGPPAGEDRGSALRMVLAAAAVLTAQLAAWTLLGFGWGLACGLLGMGALGMAGALLRRPIARGLLLGVHLFVLGAQLVCLFFTQSRGPWLGLGVGVAVAAVVYLLGRGKARAALALSAAGLLAGVFVIWLNVPNSPFAALREVPYLGRLGQLLETDTGTGKVRVLIWEGAANMVGSDAGRALAGYGPESMYVAFGPFYPADLAHYEARNRSPDRAHNEMWDALISTGILGLAAYLALFGSTFYLGVRAMGLLGSTQRRRAFGACLGVGAVVGTAAPLVVDGSWRYVGVGLPLGILAGMAAYAAGLALSEARRPSTLELHTASVAGNDLILVAALLAGIVAHFSEIHLGIAIAATRTCFWAWAAILVVLGDGWMEPEARAVDAQPVVGGSARPSRRRAVRRGPSREQTSWVERLAAHPVTVMALVSGLVLAVMAWDFFTNPHALGGSGEVMVQSLTRLSAADGTDTRSAGMLWLFVATLASGGVLSVAGGAAPAAQGRSPRWWLRAAGLYLGLAGGLGLAYGVLHARTLTAVRDPSLLPYGLVAVAAVVWLALAAFVGGRHASAPSVRHAATPIVGTLVLVALLVFVDARNLRVVRADIVHKEGTKYDAQEEWTTAAALYEQAYLMEPDEDYYLLFWGRALLEVAADEQDAATRGATYQQALSALEEARRLNPLNTDHSANIARLYRRWAYDTADADAAQSRRLLARDAYAQAAVLSPNNAQIRNEWALAYRDLGDLAYAEAKYRESLALDSEFAQTYLLLGELYQSQDDWSRAQQAYARATALDPTSLQSWASLGGAYASLGDWDAAIDAFQRGLDVDYRVPRLWGYLGDAYSRKGDYEAAVDAYQRAVALDDTFVEGWRALADHLVLLERWADAEQALQRIHVQSPDDYTSLRMLAQVVARQGRPAEAISYAERALGLAPEGDRAALEELLAELRAAVAEGTSQP